VAVALGILLALVVAGVVLLLASASEHRPQDGAAESPWRAFRRGLAARKSPEPDQLAAASAAQASPVDLSLADFLRQTTEEGEGYLNVDDLSDNLQRARDKAARAIPLRRYG
jgi:hypothetical protein